MSFLASEQLLVARLIAASSIWSAPVRGGTVEPGDRLWSRQGRATHENTGSTSDSAKVVHAEDDRESTSTGLQPEPVGGGDRFRKRATKCGWATTNLPFENWTEVLGSERLTGAALDRLTHRCHILETRGESYRLQDAKRRRRAT